MSVWYSQEEFYRELKRRLAELLKEKELYTEEVKISARALAPEEAIGNPKRKDFPIIAGKDVMIQAQCRGVCGQAFTNAPAVFHGTLQEICGLGLEDAHNRSLFIAALNAAAGYLGIASCTVHCKNEGPELCAKEAVKLIKEKYGSPMIGLIGYQPSLLENLSKEFRLRVSDLNEDNIGHERYGVMVEDGADDNVWREICDHAGLILCTGSTVCNGTILNFLPYLDKTLFFGTTIAGAAALMDLPRMCFADVFRS